MESNRSLRIKVLLLSLMLAGCAKLPDSSYRNVPEHNSLKIMQQDRAFVLAVHPNFNVSQYDGLILGEVTMRKSIDGNKKEVVEHDDLDKTLIQHLTPRLKGSNSNGLRMDVEIYDIQPVSPTLNVLSAVVLLVPLDSGELTMKTTFRDNTGQVQAVRIERLSGSVMNISEGFSRYGRLTDALAEWTTHWDRWPACMSEKKANT
ncbi:hypothetical protein [Serratia aquatilis]|uniref:DUF3313 domain-containing protein n=1 Tax=Serratia aquatilis TaxID=1737515 RepID=A0ABV6EDD4_9GAMM